MLTVCIVFNTIRIAVDERPLSSFQDSVSSWSSMRSYILYNIKSWSHMYHLDHLSYLTTWNANYGSFTMQGYLTPRTGPVNQFDLASHSLPSISVIYAPFHCQQLYLLRTLVCAWNKATLVFLIINLGDQGSYFGRYLGWLWASIALLKNSAWYGCSHQLYTHEVYS